MKKKANPRLAFAGGGIELLALGRVDRPLSSTSLVPCGWTFFFGGVCSDAAQRNPSLAWLCAAMVRVASSLSILGILEKRGKRGRLPYPCACEVNVAKGNKKIC